MYDVVRLGSKEALLKEALELLKHFRLANAPPREARPGALPSDSFCSVRTTPDGRVEFNYASFAVRSMVLVDTMIGEAIVCEAQELAAIGRLPHKTEVHMPPP